MHENLASNREQSDYFDVLLLLDVYFMNGFVFF